MMGRPMINDALDFIRSELRDHLGVTDQEVVVESARRLSDDNNIEGAYITLINVQEETALRNLPHTERVLGQSRLREPPVHLNLYLLFAFEFQSYTTSLLHLSNTVELFQGKRFFSADNQRPGNPFPATLDRLIFDFHNMSFEELNHLWGVMGGAYFPSVVYKVRVIEVRAAEAADAPEITTIALEAAQR